MLEYVITLVFAILLFYPLQMSLYVKLLELTGIVFVSYKNPLLGIICAAIFIKQFPIESMVVHVKKPFRMALDEQIRPKDSNTLLIMKSEGVPPQSSLTGNMVKPYVENHTGKYTPF
jgi:hypothetical protein